MLKWDIGRIMEREWNPTTYGPTQKLVAILAESLRGSEGVRSLLHEHCTNSLLEYVNKYDCCQITV